MAALCNGRRGDRPNALLACVAMWWSGSDCDDDDDEDHSHEVGEALEISVSRTREKTHNTQHTTNTHTCERDRNESGCEGGEGAFTDSCFFSKSIPGSVVRRRRGGGSFIAGIGC